MATRVDIYMPIKPGNDPCSLGPKSSFQDGGFSPSVENYDIYEDRGDVFVFRTTAQHGCRCSKFMAHGMVVLADAEVLAAEYAKKYPRRRHA